ncbi:MAG: putative coenzyme ligase, partial [Variovorax sp.]|nr:putative coenzyme ligase [Variovorax sp.]
MNSTTGAIDADTYALRDLTFFKVLRRQAQAHPDKTFLTETATGRQFSYGQMERWSHRVANALDGLGISRGGHTGVLMGNSAEHLAVFFGIGELGAVSVPINTAARGELLRYYLAQSDCESVIVDDSLTERLAEVLPQLPLVKRVLVVRSGEAAAVTGAATSGLVSSAAYVVA